MQREAAFRNLERANADLTKANANLVNEVAALKERVSKAERIRKKYPLPPTESQLEDGEDDEASDGTNSHESGADIDDPDAARQLFSGRVGSNRKGRDGRSPGTNSSILGLGGDRGTVNIHVDAVKRKTLETASFSPELMTSFIHEIEGAHRAGRIRLNRHRAVFDRASGKKHDRLRLGCGRTGCVKQP